MTKPTLLIVEDDEDIRTQMKWALASDYEVVLAEDQAGGLAAFMESRPVVIDGSVRHRLRLGLIPSVVEGRIGGKNSAKSNGVPAEMHVFKDGAHGSGLGMQNAALAEWPRLLANWLRASGLMK